MQKGTFIWDNSLEPVNYSNWAPDEPSNGGWEAETEDCAVMDFTRRNGLWNDIRCDLNASALCESLPSLEEPPISTNLYMYVGIGVGGFVLLLILFLFFFFYCIRKKQENVDVNNDNDLYTYSTYIDKKESLDSYDTYYT